MVIETKKVKVLIVDDDKFLLNMYSIKFSKNGFEVQTGVGGADALKIIHDGYTPDVILLDLVMPGMDGLELLTKIKAENLAPKATVIMLTNQGQPSDIKRAEDIGVAGYIVKATTIPSEVVDEVVKLYQARKA